VLETLIVPTEFHVTEAENLQRTIRGCQHRIDQAREIGGTYAWIPLDWLELLMAAAGTPPREVFDIAVKLARHDSAGAGTDQELLDELWSRTSYAK
jgi:hypothetical protein